MTALLRVATLAVMLFSGSGASADESVGAFSFGNFANTVPEIIIGAELRDVFGLHVPHEFWVALDVADIPESVARETMFARDGSIACDRATRDWYREQTLLEYGEVFEAEDVAWVRRDYVESCLTPIETVSDPKGGWDGVRPENSRFLRILLGDEGFERLQASLVRMPARFGRCSGTLVWINKDGTDVLGLLTAAHCLGSRTFRQNNGRLVADFVLYSTMNLIDQDDNTIKFGVHDSNRQRVYDVVGDDVAFVPLETNATPDQLGVRLHSATVAPWQHLYLVGENKLLAQHRAYLRRHGVDAPLGATTISLGATCRALGQHEDLLFHNCQTIEGTSGAGVFAIEDGEIRLVAVHSGYVGQFEAIKTANPNFFALMEGALAANYATIFRATR